MDAFERRCLARELEIAIAWMADRAADAKMEWVLHQGDDGARLYRKATRRERALRRLVAALAKMAGA